MAAAALLLAGCTTLPAPGPGLPGTLLSSDDGTISGVWRGEGAFVATIDLRIGTFVAKRGCTMSGGVLVSLGSGRHRIERYDNDSHASFECGPWRNGPDIAPFDGAELTLIRTGDRLLARGGGRSLTLVRDRR